MRPNASLFALALAISPPALATEVVPVAAFRSVELRGGGDVVLVPGPTQRVTILEGSSEFTRVRVESDGKLRIDACNDRCPHAYRLRVEIQIPHVPPVGVHGGGSMHAASGFGPQNEVAAGVSGGGKIDLRTVAAKTATAGVNGGGVIVVRASSSLAAGVTGGGEVRYFGNPVVTSGVQGGGAVRPAQ
jgi:hypothetical protein